MIAPLLSPFQVASVPASAHCILTDVDMGLLSIRAPAMLGIVVGALNAADVPATASSIERTSLVPMFVVDSQCDEHPSDHHPLVNSTVHTLDSVVESW
jgi:hypothetical protein